MKTRWLAWVVLAVAAAANVARGAEDAVKVEKGEVKVEYKSFDPKNPPNPPPPLEGNEAAVCVYQFGVESSIAYGYRQPRDPSRGSAVDVSGITVRLSLSITIWLPNDAPAQLKAHEEGHRTISEHFYKGADAIAREHAKKVVGKKIPIKGNDLEAAAKAAIEKINQDVCAKVMGAIEGPCGRAQDVYDQITAHGTKGRPTSEEAVKLAIDRVKDGKVKARGKRE